ncbi:MAG TPA: glycosyltransferase [Thermoplasmatales archaeon]|nr:glycosyltransferase [Thermoplasmatales archaeon]
MDWWITVDVKILYGICSWGLGHATRSLPIIRKFIREGEELTIISHGYSLEFLKSELKEEEIKYFDVKDYPIPVSETRGELIAKSIVYWPKFMRRMDRGIRFVTKLSEKEKFDVIISDGRYDIYSRKIPSYFITHQVRILTPFRLRILEFGSEIFNLFFLRRFRKFLIPDYEEEDLSGKLSHNLKLIKKHHLAYIGVLSDFKKRGVRKDVDYLISLSGPEPQRGILEKILMEQIKELDGKIVFTLGRPDKNIVERNGNIEIYSIVNKEKREELMNRAKLIISRSGYSTIMDLAVIKTKALMIPTPGQIEQEYLAEYHNEKGTFYSVKQCDLELKRDVEKAFDATGVKRKCSVEETVERVMEITYNVR